MYTISHATHLGTQLIIRQQKKEKHNQKLAHEIRCTSNGRDANRVTVPDDSALLLEGLMLLLLQQIHG